MHPSHFGHWIRKIRIRRVRLVPDTFLIVWTHDVKLWCIWGWWPSLRYRTTWFVLCCMYQPRAPIQDNLTRALLLVSTSGTACICQMNFSVDVAMFQWEESLPMPIRSVWCGLNTAQAVFLQWPLNWDTRSHPFMAWNANSVSTTRSIDSKIPISWTGKYFGALDIPAFM